MISYEKLPKANAALEVFFIWLLISANSNTHGTWEITWFFESANWIQLCQLIYFVIFIHFFLVIRKFIKTKGFAGIHAQSIFGLILEKVVSLLELFISALKDGCPGDIKMEVKWSNISQVLFGRTALRPWHCKEYQIPDRKKKTYIHPISYFIWIK